MTYFDLSKSKFRANVLKTFES